MTKEELRFVINTLIDTHNAAVKVSESANLDKQSKAYIEVRLNSVVESCLMLLIGSFSAEQKIPYNDRKLTELAEMESYLKGEKVAVRPTTPITMSLLKTLIDDRIEIWESSRNPFLVLNFIDVEKEYNTKRQAQGM